jgi:peptidyl-prolyl cis-trans isomerase B (cyclophilin B)
MPSEKRQRQDEARLNKRVAMQTASKRQQRNRGARNIGIILVVLIVGALGYSLLSNGGGKKDVTTESTTSTSAPASSTTVAGADIQVAYPGAGAAIAGDTPCPPADGSAKRTTSFAKAPPTCIKAGTTYTAKVATSEGDFTIQLDPTKAPIAVNSFVVLARYHYYDGVPFHRIIPGFVDQAGTPISESDPAITKTPGYTIKDELPTGVTATQAYPEGTLAVANTGSPDTGSSQFFVVVGSGGAQLEVKYTPFGKVTAGLDVVKAINAFGDAATNGTPTKKVTITSVTISEG